MAPDAVSPRSITRQEFDDVLARYGPLVEFISTSKGVKPGQKSLEELDRFRYDEGPRLFQQEKPSRPMSHDDVKTLVDWKLRHGKFRPTLMKLVSSNDSAAVQDNISEALVVYGKVSDVSKTLNTLTKLRGIGPATASLLLAVHFPTKVPFFSDEAYYWLCNDGRSESLKYTMKEYEALISESQHLMKRLDVSALDIEKVAYVLMKQGTDGGVVPGKSAPSKPSKPGKAAPQAPEKKKSATVKRKATPEETSETQPSLRRSKRGKGA